MNRACEGGADFEQVMADLDEAAAKRIQADWIQENFYPQQGGLKWRYQHAAVKDEFGGIPPNTEKDQETLLQQRVAEYETEHSEASDEFNGITLNTKDKQEAFHTRQKVAEWHSEFNNEIEDITPNTGENQEAFNAHRRVAEWEKQHSEVKDPRESSPSTINWDLDKKPTVPGRKVAKSSFAANRKKTTPVPPRPSRNSNSYFAPGPNLPSSKTKPSSSSRSTSKKASNKPNPTPRSNKMEPSEGEDASPMMKKTKTSNERFMDESIDGILSLSLSEKEANEKVFHEFCHFP